MARLRSCSGSIRSSWSHYWPQWPHNWNGFITRPPVTELFIGYPNLAVIESTNYPLSYLYVNVRPWPPGCVIENPLQPPPIAQEIDIHVIDLTTFQQVVIIPKFKSFLLEWKHLFCPFQVGSLLRAHRSFTPNDECFFIFLDVSNDYVAR